MTYPWNHTIELDISAVNLTRRADVDLWVFCLLDDQGREIYRDDISDPAILGGEANRIALTLLRFGSANPVRCMVWPRQRNGEFLTRRYFQLPDDFFRANAEALAWLAATPVPRHTVTCDIFGGLGNQLFQIMTTLVFARDNGYTALFDVTASESRSMVENQDTYWDTVFHSVRADAQRYRCPLDSLSTWADPAFTYTPIAVVGEHIRLYGYFTSFRYLDHGWIREQLFSNRALGDTVDAAFAARTARLAGRELVSVHVRRGDSLRNPTLEKPDPRYFRAAMAQFPGAHFLLFSDDLPWCRTWLGDSPDVTYCSDQPAYIDMLMMSRCDHHIISNSTFSWWGAWLNDKPDARVIHPYPWFRGEKHARSFSDFIPAHWTSLPP